MTASSPVTAPDPPWRRLRVFATSADEPRARRASDVTKVVATVLGRRRHRRVPPHLVLPMRRLGRSAVGLTGLSVVALGAASALGAAVGLIAAAGAAATVHLVFGSSAGRPSLELVAADLEELGVATSSVVAAEGQEDGLFLVRAVAADGTPIDVKVYGRDAYDSAVLSTVWQTVWYRDAGPLARRSAAARSMPPGSPTAGSTSGLCSATTPAGSASATSAGRRRWRRSASATSTASRPCLRPCRPPEPNRPSPPPAGTSATRPWPPRCRSCNRRCSPRHTHGCSRKACSIPPPCGPRSPAPSAATSRRCNDSAGCRPRRSCASPSLRWPRSPCSRCSPASTPASCSSSSATPAGGCWRSASSPPSCRA